MWRWSLPIETIGLMTNALLQCCWIFSDCEKLFFFIKAYVFFSFHNSGWKNSRQMFVFLPLCLNTFIKILNQYTTFHVVLRHPTTPNAPRQLKPCMRTGRKFVWRNFLLYVAKIYFWLNHSSLKLMIFWICFCSGAPARQTN